MQLSLHTSWKRKMEGAPERDTVNIVPRATKPEKSGAAEYSTGGVDSESFNK